MISAPQNQYRDGILVTGHAGIQVTSATLSSSLAEDKEAPKDYIAEETIVSEESQSYSLQRAVLERRDEEGEDEMEVGKTFSAPFIHINADFHILVLPNDR